MQQRLQGALEQGSYSSDTLSANTESQLQRCLKAEVIQDLPTPGEFSRQRMAYQIERLSNSMKKNTGALENIDTLKRELLTTGPIVQDQHEAIWARIDSIVKI